MRDLKERLAAALAEDDDHMVASGRDLTWLAAQLACWPTRVDENCTTNDRFLRLSAAATLSQLEADKVRLEEALADIRDMTDPDDEDSYRNDDREGCLETVFETARQALGGTDGK